MMGWDVTDPTQSPLVLKCSCWMLDFRFHTGGRGGYAAEEQRKPADHYSK